MCVCVCMCVCVLCMYVNISIKKNLKMGFVDDFKMIADVTVKSKAKVQLEIDSIAK